MSETFVIASPMSSRPTTTRPSASETTPKPASKSAITDRMIRIVGALRRAPLTHGWAAGFDSITSSKPSNCEELMTRTDRQIPNAKNIIWVA